MDVVHISKARQARERREDAERRLRTQTLERKLDEATRVIDDMRRTGMTLLVLAVVGWVALILVLVSRSAPS